MTDADPATSPPRRRPPDGVSGLVTQLAVVGAAVVADLAVRFWTLDDRGQAMANARDLLVLERSWGLDLEHAVQEATMAVPLLDSFLAHVYVWGYLPVVLGGLVWTYARRRGAYVRLRDALLVSGAVGLVGYVVFPCAPPRLLPGAGFVDTVAESSLNPVARPAGLANEIAAMPSFHVGWLLVTVVVLLTATRSRTLRILLPLDVALMCLAIVASGNHWVLDIPAGAVVAGAGLVGAGLLDRGRRASAHRRSPGSGPPRVPDPARLSGSI